MKYLQALGLIVLLTALNVWICHDFVRPEIGSDGALAALTIVQMVIMYTFKYTVLATIIYVLFALVIVGKLLLFPFFLMGRAFQQGKQSVKEDN